nr:uncharacterized protein K02A2.6-like [Aedes albopictus]
MASPDAAAAGAAGHAMPASFNFEPFNAATAKFDRWLERLEISFRIYKVAPADKRDYLLHYMGSSTYDVLCNKLQNQSPETQTYADIVALLRSHYSPAPLEILENYKFICRKQLEHEALCDYITDLEKLAQTCNFGAHLDTTIRNQFVFGLRNRTIQSRLLEVRNLTLAKAKEIAFSMEMSHRGTDEMHGSTSKTEIQYLEHGKQKKKKPITKPMTPTTKPKPTTPTQGKACYRCGDPDHFANKCRHQSTICNFCKRKGHLEKVCQTKLRGNPKKAPEKAVTHHIEDSPVIKDVFHLRSTPGFADKFMLDLKVDGRTLTFEVDTGSPVSLISSHDQRRYFKDFPIHPTATKLVSYCDTDINVPGKIFVKVMSNGDELTLPLHVAESNRHPIMGRDWLLRLNIDFNSVFKPGMHSISHFDSSGESTPNALNNLLNKYSRVFDGNVGKITGVQASLNLRADAQPVYIKHRPVAFSVRDAVEKGIDKFVKDGLEVREEDRGLLTLSTHKGLYRPTRLMYGVASAPAVFQRLMEQILQGIPGVTVFIDDIRVTGPDDESHLRRLEEVLKRLEAHGMRANRDKCEFFSSQIDYCGYSVDKFGIHKLQTKIHAIQSMPVPSDKEQWPDVHIVKNMTTDTTIQACRQFFSTYGIPSVLVSDNGPQFTSGEFAKFLDLNGVVHKFSAPYHPATNGQAERFIQTMKLKLKAIDCNRSQIHGELCSILMSYRKMIHPTTGLSPSMMVYGRQIRSRLDLMVPSGNSNDREAAGKVRKLEPRKIHKSGTAAPDENREQQQHLSEMSSGKSNQLSISKRTPCG